MEPSTDTQQEPTALTWECTRVVDWLGELLAPITRLAPSTAHAAGLRVCIPVRLPATWLWLDQRLQPGGQGRLLRGGSSGDINAVG